MKKLLSCIAALFTIFFIVSCLQEERSPEEILVPSPAEVDCSESFSITSKVPKGSEKLVEECGFLVGTTKDLADALTVEGAMTENTFSAALPARKYGTTYYICSYVTNGRGSEIRSDLISYELKSLDEYVSFGKIKLLSYHPLTKLAEIIIPAEIQPGVNVTEVGVCYGSSESLSDEDTYVEGTISEDGTITVSLEGFKDGTQYYMRPYIKENEYIAYASTSPFLIPTVPVVITYPAEEITSESAVLSAEVERGENITERGFVWLNGQGTPTIDSNKLKVDGTLGKFTASLSDLDANERYAYRAYAVNDQGVFYGDILTFTTLAGAASLSATKVTNITTTSATFTCTVTSHGGETVSEVGYYVGKDEDVDVTTAIKVSEVFTSMTFTLTVEGLEVGQDYFVKAYALNSAGEGYSDISTFKTTSTAPSVITVGSSELSATSAELSGEVSDDNGAEITERGFIWMLGEGVPTIDSYKITTSGKIGDYTATVKDLAPNQKYSFRAYAVNSVGTSYGETISFTTSISKASLASVTISNIEETSATISSKVTGHGGDTVSEVGFYYSTEEAVDPEKSVKVNRVYSSDSFSISISGLAINTKYYVKAYAVNSAGAVYSDVASFTTLASTPVVNTVGSSGISSTGAVLSGTVVTDNGAAITERGFVWLQGTGNPTTDSFKLKVDGTMGAFTATLTDLSSNQVYSFRAYAINSKGISYGETLTFKTDVALPVVEFTGCSDVTSSSAVVSGKVTDHGGETVSETGFLYGTTPVLDPSTASRVKSTYSGDSFSFTLSGLTRAHNYYVQPFATNSKGTSYGDVTMFTTLPSLPIVTTNDVTAITDNSAMSGGVVADDGGADILAKGIVWSRSKNPTVDLESKTDEGTGLGAFSSTMSNLTSGSTYYVRTYATNVAGTGYGKEMEFKTTGEAPYIALEAANCFIVSSSETYSFKTVKGNSSESVGDVASAEVLWESFGTSETPSVGSLIASVAAESGSIVFEVADPYREGNAVIAAKDASGTILWSWHIWLTDEPEGQVYYNNAGTMMDRNLGATSATPGDVGALGLLYQWGRKDPFLGFSSISSSTVAKSTLTWPSSVSSNSSNGTISYATEHPTTFITYNSNKLDWYYTGSSSADNTRWQSAKTIYDPCPAGWRVPDGGSTGIWSEALGSSSGFADASLYDSTNEGINFSGRFGNASTIWYPASGCRDLDDGALDDVGSSGYYWSVTPSSYYAYNLSFYNYGNVSPTNSSTRALGYSVRCVQESE